MRQLYLASLFILGICFGMSLEIATAHAATGFQFGNNCYSSLSDVAGAVQAQPLNLGSGHPTIIQSATVAASGVAITYTNDASGSLTSSFNFQPPTCNTPVTIPYIQSAISSSQEPDLLLVIGCCLAMILGIRTGQAS